MNKIVTVHCFAACTFFISVLSMKEEAITYRRVKKADISSLLHLVNTCAVKDSQKIVVVPEKFREAYVESAIKSTSLFGAFTGETPIAYKKAFLIADSDKDSILRGEIRCRAGKRTLSGFYNGPTKVFTSTADTSQYSYPDSDIYIYTGADFTHPEYRGRGVNTHLTNASFDSLKEPTRAAILHASPSARLVLAYGLTAFNAGQKGGVDRTLHILNSFIPFLKDLSLDITHIDHERFEAFMPTFDSSSKVCVPLPDERSIPGYGCIVSVPLISKGK